MSNNKYEFNFAETAKKVKVKIQKKIKINKNFP